MADEEIELQLVENVLRVRLNRPAKMNAVNLDHIDRLHDIFLSAATNGDVRCLWLSAAGRAFCAGRDLADARPNEDGRAILTDRINPMVKALYDCPKPTLASVNGAAMGIGLGLALACDLVLASESAVFSSPFARLGGALDTGGHYFLSRRLTPGLVFEMVYTARTIGGGEAARLGIADKVMHDDILEASAAALANQIARGPQVAFQGQKALLREVHNLSLGDVLAREADLQGALAATPEYAEGLAAFHEKRAPDFRAATKGQTQ